MRTLRFALARVTIETTTPLAIGTGGGDDLRDALCVTDCNGLPTIPGSSIAGALRHTFSEFNDPDTDPRVGELFGWQGGDDGAASRLQVSWAEVHDATNRPVSCLVPGLKIDPVLDFVRTGVTRDHVRLNAAGAADGHGKFDESAVPTGARFTFELKLDDPRPGEMESILDLVRSVRLGGKTRRGRGAFKVVSASKREFDLTKPEHRDAWRKLPRRFCAEVPKGVLEPVRGGAKGRDDAVSVTLKLEPEGDWMIGGGTPDPDLHKLGDKLVELVPVRERRIVWLSDRGAIETRPAWLVPATAVKGALAHRTAYYWRRIVGQWHAGPARTEDAWNERPEPVQALLGWVAPERHEGSDHEDQACAGAVYLDDLYVPAPDPQDKNGMPKTRIQQHVSLDRFTGGPMDGMLFAEAPLSGGSLALTVTIDPRVKVEPAVRRAFERALADLAAGRLALGAASNRGHGYFRGSVDWNEQGKSWLEGGAR